MNRCQTELDLHESSPSPPQLSHTSYLPACSLSRADLFEKLATQIRLGEGGYGKPTPLRAIYRNSAPSSCKEVLNGCGK